MDDRVTELQEKLSRYKRALSPDMLKTLDEVDAELGVVQPSAVLIKRGVAPESIFILSGMRDYSSHLRHLIEQTEADLKAAKQPQETTNE